jgi:hypothetical protein
MSKLVMLAAGVLIMLPLVLMILAGGPSTTLAVTDSAAEPTAAALDDIPPQYLAWYMDAAQTCSGLSWAVLAGIGTVESDNGQSDAPGVHSGANFAGAEGRCRPEQGQPVQIDPVELAGVIVATRPSELSSSSSTAQEGNQP